MIATVIHPARFSAPILELLAVLLDELLPTGGAVLDPFSGTGRIHELATPTRTTVGVEIEPEWAACHPRTVQGDATALPFPSATFDAVVTSCCYGNRFADHHNAQDGSRRRGYTHDLRRMTGDPARRLHVNNTGALYAWQPRYWDIHERAWSEVHQVLRPGGPFLLNVSDCRRRGKVVQVVERHAALCQRLGFRLVARHPVGTPRMRYGANREARAEHEVVLIFERGAGHVLEGRP
jgi:SAM-dependent methyltransferase